MNIVDIDNMDAVSSVLIGFTREDGDIEVIAMLQKSMQTDAEFELLVRVVLIGVAHLGDAENPVSVWEYHDIPDVITE